MVQNESFVAYNNQMMHKKSSLSNWIKHKYMYKAKLTRTNSKTTAKWTPSTNILPSQHYPVCSNMMPFYLLIPFWPDSNCVLAKRFLICCMYSDFRSATFNGIETLGVTASFCFIGLLANGGVLWPFIHVYMHVHLPLWLVWCPCVWRHTICLLPFWVFILRLTVPQRGTDFM